VSNYRKGEGGEEIRDSSLPREGKHTRHDI
jgi:hypothetical protein